MADKKDKFDAEATSSSIDLGAGKAADTQAAQGEAPAEDYNATMMAIDVGKLNLEPTKTQIKIDVPSDEEIIQEEIEQKKSPLMRFIGQLRQALTPAKSEENTATRELPRALKPFEDKWICNPNAGPRGFAGFYLSRLFLLGLSVYLHVILFGRVMAAVNGSHPASVFFMIVSGFALVMVLLAFLFKASPGWVVVWPSSAIAMLIAYGAMFYHTADKLYLDFDGALASEILNTYFLTRLGYGAFAGVFLIADKFFARIANLLLMGLALAPVVANSVSGTLFEFSFFTNPLGGAPGGFLNPTVLLLHAILPFLTLYFLVRSFFSGHTGPERVAAGFARAQAFLCLSLTLLGITLMQQNRVFHLGNLILPMTLNVGAAEIEVNGRKLEVETKTFAKHEGADTMSRYQFLLKTSKKPDQYQLLAVDQYNFPVKGLGKSDLNVSLDGQKVKEFKISEENGGNRGSYLLTLKIDAKEPLVKWSAISGALKPDDKITFTLSEPDKVGSLVVMAQDEPLVEVKDPKANVEFGLFHLDDGDHALRLILRDIYDQEIFKQDLKLKIASEDGFKILKPADGESVGESLEVLLAPTGAAVRGASPIVVSVDGQELSSGDSPSGFFALDTSLLPDGPHSLQVTAKIKDKVVSHTVNFRRVTQAPKLSITSPSMGAFATRETKLEYRLIGGAASVAKANVFVNGFLLADLKPKNNSVVLPVSQWQADQLFVTVQAKLDNDETVSDWVQVNKGLSALKLSFDAASLPFLSLNAIAFVLDASVSSWDNWMGSSKWHAVREVITDGDVEAKLERMKTTLVVFGSEKPHYFKDCGDIEVPLKSGVFDAGDVKKILGLKPKGVSALVAGLRKALGAKPEKIFVFTDAADACKKNLVNALEDALKGAPATRVYVYALGNVDADAKAQLTALADKTGGRYYQPDNREALKESLLEQLQLSYSLETQGKVLAQGPFESRTFKLVPGAYVLRIPYGLEQKSLEFKLENGVQKALSISGENGQIIVEDKTEKGVK